MTSKRILIKTILTNSVVFFMFYGVLAVAFYLLYGNMGAVYASFSLIVVFFFLMLIRLKVNNIFIFILLHLVVILIPMLCVQDILMKVALVAFLTVSVIYSISARINGEWRVDTALLIIGLAIQTALVFLSDYFGYQSLQILFKAFSLSTILCALLYIHIENLDYALEIVTAHSNHPTHTILLFNNVMITIFLAVTVMAGVISTFFPMGRLMGMLGRVLVTILRFLFQFLPVPKEEPIPEPVAETPRDMSDMLGAPPPEHSQLFIILEKIMYYFVLAATIVLILSAICYGIYRFYKKFYSSKQTSLDLKESIAPDITVTVIKELWAGLKALLPTFNTPIHPIRKTYVKKINGHIKRGITLNPSDTTQTIATKINPQENINELTMLYEKVRYGENKLL